MKLQIHTSQPRFGFDLAADLEAKSFGDIAVRVQPTDCFGVFYRPTVAPRLLSSLLDALWPLMPERIDTSENLKDADIQLHLGSFEAAGYPIVVFSDSAACAEVWRSRLDPLGFRIDRTEPEFIAENALCCSEAPRSLRQMLHWYTLRQGISLVVRDDGCNYGQFSLYLRDPLLAAKPVKQRYPIIVATDDIDAGRTLINYLDERGYTCSTMERLEEADALRKPILLQPGALENSAGEADKLQAAVHSCLTEQGIDLARYPIQRQSDNRALRIRITLPVKACQARKKPAYAGPYPERFQVTIVTDQAGGLESLQQRLMEAGFGCPAITVKPSLLDGLIDAGLENLVSGFSIAWDEAGRLPFVASLVREAVRKEMEERDIIGFSVKTRERTGGSPTEIQLHFPQRGVTDGGLLAKICDPCLYRLRLATPRRGDWQDFADELRTWNWQSFQTEEANDSNLCYGGAPLELVQRLRDTVRARTGTELYLNRCWPDTDLTIFCPLPAPLSAARPSSAGRVSASAGIMPDDIHTQLDRWASDGRCDADCKKAVLAVAEENIRIASVRLPRQSGPRHALAPHPSAFRHFCLDRVTVATLEHLATSVLVREASLLEGETSTSKTSSILFLAALLNQPVVRLNLNGQTDTGELVGRFVPDTATKETAGHPWRWQDGLVPQAMKNGWWVLLDEVNLAEPQILERLNSVLESDPSLILTEHDNTVIGRGGTPVHGAFRIFATMNPAEYAGRTALSPAYRDRWRGYRAVPRPGEEEYLAMLRLLVFGERPECSVGGCSYTGGTQEPCYPLLADLPAIDVFLEALARFHAAVEHAVGQADSTARIGSRRKERYVFTRRGLLGVLEYLASPLFADDQLRVSALRQALLRYYLFRVAAQDRAVMVQLLDAHGIGPNTWSLPS